MWDEKTLKALHDWLAISTWHTTNSLDQDRFFAFVHAAWLQHQGLWDEAQARVELLSESHRLDPDVDELHRELVIDARCREAAAILQFLEYAKEHDLRLWKR